MSGPTVLLHGDVAPPSALRCPVCASPVHPYRTIRFGEELRCIGCRRAFDLLPSREGGFGVTSDDGRSFISGGSSWGVPTSSDGRSPERASLDVIERDPAYRRRNYRGRG